MLGLTIPKESDSWLFQSSTDIIPPKDLYQSANAGQRRLSITGPWDLQSHGLRFRRERERNKEGDEILDWTLRKKKPLLNKSSLKTNLNGLSILQISVDIVDINITCKIELPEPIR